MKLKGGFQSIDLSAADLTASTLKVEGLSKACSGANDKPVRIKMPGGVEYYGSLKPTESGFEISFLGADSKAVQIAVDDTDDTFTMTESEPLTDGEPDYIPDYGNRVDLTNYISTNRYKAPCDGYIKCIVGDTGNAAGDKASCIIRGKSGESYTAVEIIARYNSEGSLSRMLFVKKGMLLYGTTSGTGTGVKSVEFYPIIEV